MQVLGREISTSAHDVPMDYLITPERVIETEAEEKPTGIDWEALSEEKVADIPILERSS